MKKLSEEKVNLIRRDLVNSGITLPELLDDLLDHLCTGIEEEMAAGSNFDTAYEQLRELSIPGGAGEIQSETLYLLNYKQQLIMRKFLFLTGFIWAFTTLTGIMFNVFHWPMGNALVQGSGLILGLVLIPSFIIYQVRDHQPKTGLQKALSVSGILVSGVVSFGVFFKLMHWPGANVLLMLSLVSLTFIFLPLVMIYWYRREANLERVEV